MKCLICGFLNPEDIQFCGKCGSKLVLLCPKCKIENPYEFSFCGKCGNSLKQPSAISSAKHQKPKSYTPKHLADKILNSRACIEGERKLVTVLFADVANFTSISGKLDPEEIHQMMDDCFKILMAEIHKYEGTINQFTGDGAMALFGAPVAHEDHAQRACLAAIGIQKNLENYSRKLEIQFDIQFQMRVGINSGLVVVGSIGDDLRMDYTAVGDTTNLASRMETFARPGTILLSEKTQKIVKDFFELNLIGEINVKGKEKQQKAFQLIRRGDVQTRIGASQIKGLTRFVGRKNSMQSLVGAFEKAKSGSGQIVGVVGEAGVGKSRLLLEMKNAILHDDYGYYEGRCLQYGGSILYLPILDILKAIISIKEDDNESTINAKINNGLLNLSDQPALLKPSLQDILSVKVKDEEYTTLEPKQKRERIFEALRDLLIRISQDRPLILAVEDLHWIDKTSEEFLGYFIDWLPNTQILIILLYRPEYTHQWGSKSFYTRIGVDQLGMSSSGDLVKAILYEGDVSPELNQIILTRSAGNPLFMEEFTNTLLENGSIEKQNSKFGLKDNSRDIQVPDTIQGIIAARLDRLDDNLKKTMQVASVIGRDFAFRILQTITEMRSELKSHLLNLQGLEFIYEKKLFPELEYIFKHALTQEVAYNSLLQKRRKLIHGKIGEAIEELYAERLEEFYEMLAYHYCKSNDNDKAIHYLMLSADKAAKKFSHWNAYHFYKTAYDILDKLQDTKRILKKKLVILKLIEYSFSALGMPPEEGLWSTDEGIKTAEKFGDSSLTSKAYLAKANYYSHRGKTELSLKYSENAFVEACKKNDIDLMVHSSWALTVALAGSGNYSKIISVAPKVIELLEKEERKTDYFFFAMSPYSILCSYCGVSYGYLGHFDEGLFYLEKSIKNATSINDSLSPCAIELGFGMLFVAKGEWEVAKDYFQSAILHSQEVNFPWVEGSCHCMIGYSKSMTNEHSEILKQIELGLDIHDKSGVAMFLANSYLFSGAALIETGNLQMAKECLEKALELAQKNSDNCFAGLSHLHLGHLLSLNKHPQQSEALNHISKGMNILEKLNIKPYYSVGYLYLGEHFLKLNDIDKAIKNLKNAENLFQEMGIEFWLNKTKKLLSEIWK